MERSILIQLGMLVVFGCCRTSIRWRSALFPMQSRKSKSPSWYKALTLLGFSQLYMLVLGVSKGTFCGTIFLKKVVDLHNMPGVIAG